MKKILTTLGMIGALATPIISVISCGSDDTKVVEDVEEVEEVEEEKELVGIKLADDIIKIFEDGVKSDFYAGKIYDQLSAKTEDMGKWTPLPFLFTEWYGFNYRWGTASGHGLEELQAIESMTKRLQEDTGNELDFASITLIELDEMTDVEQESISGKMQIDYTIAENDFRPAKIVFDFSIETPKMAGIDKFWAEWQEIVDTAKIISTNTTIEDFSSLENSYPNVYESEEDLRKLGVWEQLNGMVPEGYTVKWSIECGPFVAGQQGGTYNDDYTLLGGTLTHPDGTEEKLGGNWGITVIFETDDYIPA